MSKKSFLAVAFTAALLPVLAGCASGSPAGQAQTLGTPGSTLYAGNAEQSSVPDNKKEPQEDASKSTNAVQATAAGGFGTASETAGQTQPSGEGKTPIVYFTKNIWREGLNTVYQKLN